MSTTWTLGELVTEAARRIAALPPPKNGQVRAVPDERTIRYYAALGLLDRPAAMKGRTALYSARHLAQVVAIKRMQSAGKSLAEIEALWPSLDDGSLARMTGIAIAAKPRAGRKEFWKERREASAVSRQVEPADPEPEPEIANGSGLEPEARSLKPEGCLQLVLQLAPGISLVLEQPPTYTPADLRAIRAAAAPLLAELAKRGTMEES
ncbi:MAG TPA: MerR family transcriptional regulator [Kofleriaceae bacterium]|nr:MerR family transcriptional regulator [Kofleriaceae bacterium]